MNNCLSCGQPVKNKYCNVSCQNVHQSTGRKRSEKSIQMQKERVTNSWKLFSVVCNKCSKVFEIKEYNVESPKKEKYNCSVSCANTRVLSEETKNKIRNSLLISEKAKISNKNRQNVSSGLRIERTTSKCLGCGLDITHKINETKKYHLDCWRKNSGGVREGSSRSKHGWYKGYWCDSSYELAWVIFQLDHNISFKRNTEGFNYVFENKNKKYYPDFIMEDGLYVEIKNYKSKLTDSKLNSFPHKIIILYKEEIYQNVLPYVIENYGKNFINLYDEKQK